ncbi:MAG: serine protein kinase RIO [Candidatus Micrarchaeia archaeon]
MARRVSRRKEPERGKFQLKELEKVEGGIFDKQTMVYLSKFFNAGIVERLEFPIARGKEADLYLADAGAGEEVKGSTYVVLKFFRVETSSFKNMADYIIGDERFTRIRNNKYFIVNTWCKKEYGNLKIAEAAGVRVPKPYMSNGSVLAMEFIGNEAGMAAPMLKDIRVDNPDAMFDKIMGYVKKLYEFRLVHADLSEYNILVSNGEPCLIDFGQAVTIKHPKAEEFLERDIGNIVTYFNKAYSLGIEASDAKAMVTG